MLRIILLGRLGNNLFQYAFGRALAEQHQTTLWFDASWFNHATWPYVAPLARLPGFTRGKATLVRPFSLGSRILKKINGRHHWEYRGVPIIREKIDDHAFDPSLLDAPSDCVVFGYFQTPLYFSAIEPQLREELSTHDLGLESGHQSIADQLKAPNSVAVHVRRTDYVTNHNLYHPGISYYHHAMNRMRDSIPSAQFFIFSDDPSWCLANFTDRDTQVLTHSDPFQPLTDLHLMSLASHHIIANSSYSWWAAWLGKKSNQRVIIPECWFASGINAPIEQKLCPTWEILSSHCRSLP